MASDQRYADVAVTLPVLHLYTYRVPRAMVPLAREGARVLVPFGRRNVTGYIMALHHEARRKDLKQILDILDGSPLFPRRMIPFFEWTADYYMHPIGEVIACALPAGLSVKDYAVLSLTPSGKTALEHRAALSPIESELLHRLQKSPCRQKDLPPHVGAAVIERLIQKSWVRKTRQEKKARPGQRFKTCVSLNAGAVPGPFRSGVKNAVIDALKTRPDISLPELKQEVPSAAGVLKSLEDAGHIRRFQKKVYRDPFGEEVVPDSPPVLTSEQERAVEGIQRALGAGFAAFLLTGVAGSGKTEVYMRLAETVMQAGRPVLVLVPEIALISQVERRFRARFGECVAVLHSGLSRGERYDQWLRIREKKAPIVIGARSAVFAPVERLGLIIVDEEHESSYKQDHGLMYNARDLAVKRASLDECVVVLGSATPSIQSYFNAQAGKYTEVKLTKRVMERPLSEIHIVDLRKTRDVQGIRKFISPMLHAEMHKTLDCGHQVLLFLNRRGFSNLSVCGTCGEAIKCRHCEISMTLHRRISAYKCHYCGFSRAEKMDCPVCGSSHIRHLGLGTEKLENAVRKLFPHAVVDRMDRDTTRKRGAVRKILQGLQDNTTDILVGTQMVAKGHDFPNITLVGIICADMSLNFPDFRSGVRTFQLIAQVAGRAGRGDAPGRVILQTYHPEHFSISAARKQDFRVFFQRDIELRKALNYPPFSRLVQLRITGKTFQHTKDHAHRTGQAVRSLVDRPSLKHHLAVLGPVESAISRVAGEYRWQILIKGSQPKPLHDAMRRLITDHGHVFTNRQARVRIDVDPYFMM